MTDVIQIGGTTPSALTTALATKQDFYGTTAALSSAAGVVTISCASTTDRHELTLTENVTSWVFTNLPAAGKYREILVMVVQHASAAKTVVTPATSGRTAGGAWTVSPTLSSRELLILHVFSDGTKALFPTGLQG